MNDESFARLEHLFKAARLLAPDERTAFIEAACSGDEGLKDELKSLLNADAEATDESFLATEAPPWESVFTEASSISTLVGQHVGPYQVKRVLGRGGMGEVYLAMRDHPYRRYVALKVIRQGLNTQEVLARFNIERQILASLEHPGIARLIDGGVTQEGISYLAMEYVEGQSITVYCDEHRLSIDERLRLFQRVCDAVHYAHQNLVLHRDLKPSNILVTVRGDIKLLDFGIAKLMNPQFSPLPVPVTREAQRLLTPEYASPEQVRGESLSTASDVYSLGVLLYELLAGRRPHRLAGRSAEEMMRIVSNIEPGQPSTVVTQSYTDAAFGKTVSIEPSDIAKSRNMSTERLRKQLRGDLDAIVLRALRKEPSRRYSSAELLAQDIERHLTRQPVHARLGNRRYRIGRFIRRHRIESVAVAAVLFALLIGLGTALWQAREAQLERDRAVSARAQAEEVSLFLEGLFTASDPYAPAPERLDTLRIRDFLTRGVERLQTGLDDQPLVRANMFDVIGRVYNHLGMYDDARPLIEQAIQIRENTLGPVDTLVVQSQTHLAALLIQTGNYEQARTLLEEALALNRTAFDDHPNVAETLNHLAVAYRELGFYEEAESAHLEAIALIRRSAGERDPRLASYIRELVATLEWVGDYEKAEQYGRQAVALHRKVLGSSHPELAMALRELGLVVQRKGAYREAEELFRESLGIVEATLGDEHPQVADLLNRLASIRWWQRDLAAADSIHRKSVALNKKIYGENHLEVAYALNNLASVLRDEREFAEADSLHLSALEITRTVVGDDHSAYWILLGNRGMTLRAMGNCGLAKPVLIQAIDGMGRTIPNPGPRVSAAQRWLGGCLMDEGRYEEAETILLESHADLQKYYGDDNSMTRDAARLLETLYTRWNRGEQ